MKKVLFVCLGNICRSPTAESVFNHILSSENKSQEYIVDSAGTSAHHAGEPADPRMIRHGELRGYRFETLSRPFVRKDFDNFDYIFAMDQSNYENILKLDLNGDFENRVFRIMEFSLNFEENEVPDPYYGGAQGFELVIDMLEDACREVFKKIEAEEI